MEITTDALVIGAGPAGLMAAETLAACGFDVVVAEAKPSPARKLLMAGKSGLNLTKAEPRDRFVSAYTRGGDWLAPMLAAFGPDEVAAWAESLGQPVFTGSSSRVFPVAMKASPLLRIWLARLAARGVQVRTRWRWQGWRGSAAIFAMPDETREVTAEVTVLALGGASWPRLGSDGAWATTLAVEGIEVAPFQPSNMGFDVAWSEHMRRHFGTPVKPVALSAGGAAIRGEFVVTRNGVEGGGIYALAHHLRDAMGAAGVDLVLDLAPDLDCAEIARRLGRRRGRASASNHFRKALGLPPVKLALLREAAPGSLRDPHRAAAALKHLRLRLLRPRPIEEAISTAGGVTRAALGADLMLRARPGVFAAGEMLDWDAPTGGYLLTACLATGRHAGLGAARWLRR